MAGNRIIVGLYLAISSGIIDIVYRALLYVGGQHLPRAVLALVVINIKFRHPGRDMIVQPLRQIRRLILHNSRNCQLVGKPEIRNHAALPVKKPSLPPARNRLAPYPGRSEPSLP